MSNLSKLNDLRILGQLWVQEFMNKAGLTTEGVVQLTNAVDSDSEILAPTAKALKYVQDNAETKLPLAGGYMSGVITLKGNNNLLSINNKTAMNVNNSAITNIHQLVFGNITTNTSDMGILFLQTDKEAGSVNVDDYDIIRVENSIPYLNEFPVLFNNLGSKDTSYYTINQTDAAIKKAIDDIINGSQTTLDTLKELAEAIGNDPTFAANMAIELNKRLRLDGGIMTGDITMTEGSKVNFSDVNSNIIKNETGMHYNTDSLNGHTFNAKITVSGEIFSKDADGNIYKLWNENTFKPDDYFSKLEPFEIKGPIVNKVEPGEDATLMQFGTITEDPLTNFNWEMKFLGSNPGADGNQIYFGSNTGNGLTLDHNGDTYISGDLYSEGEYKVWNSRTWDPTKYLGSNSILQLGRYVVLGDDVDPDAGLIKKNTHSNSRIKLHVSDVPDDTSRKIFSIESGNTNSDDSVEKLAITNDGNMTVDNSVSTNEYRFNESNSRISYNKTTNCIEFLVQRSV